MSVGLGLRHLGVLAVMFAFLLGFNALFGDLSWVDVAVGTLFAAAIGALAAWFFRRRDRSSARE